MKNTYIIHQSNRDIDHHSCFGFIWGDNLKNINL